jgi:uncharacterized protein (TIGR00369 family)
MSEHFRKLENMYLSAPINSFFRPTLEVSKGRAVLTMEVRPDFFHAADAVHGSVYFKALDDAAYFAVNSLVHGHFVLTVSFNTYLLRPVTGGCLRAEGAVVSTSKNLFVADSVLFDGEDRQIARGSGTFMRSRISLDDVEAYR